MARRLTRLKINEVSSVDRGAGEGVRVVLYKRDFSSKERDQAAESGAAMSDGSFPIKTLADLRNAIQAIGRAKNPAAAKAHIISRARALGATDELPDGWTNKALEKVFAEIDLTIGKDGTISHSHKVEKTAANSLPDECKNGVEDFAAVFCKSCREIMASDEADKESLLETSYGEFVGAVGQIAPEGSEEPVKAAVLGALESGEPDMAMTDKELEALKAKAAEAETLKAEVAKRDTEIAKRDAELAIAKLSAEHKAYAEKLSDAARVKFIAMSAEERDAAVKEATKKRDEDPIFKAMNDRIAKAESENADLKKRLDAEEDAKEKIAFAKRAQDVYAQPEAFGETLRKAYKGDIAAQAEVDKVALSLRRAAEQSTVFKNFGSGGGNADSAKAQINQKAEELRKSLPTLSAEKAYSQVLMDPANKELAARVRQEERQGL